VTDRFALVTEALSRAGLLRAVPGGTTLVDHLTADSRDVRPGSLFLAVPGSQADGHAFVPDAVRRGARVVVVERHLTDDAVELLVSDGRKAAAVVARAWFGDPAAQLTVVGVTGTNGKTTTTALVRHLLNRRGDAGSIGTLGAFDGADGQVASTAGSLTTPGPVDLQATLRAMLDRGVRAVAMEASSHSLDQGRLDGIPFAGAVFTNLTRDHLDYHGTMEAYLAAKLRLASLLVPGGVCAVNLDDPAWAALDRAPGRVSFGLTSGADVRAEDAMLLAEGSRFLITGRFGRRPVELPLPGDFNVANALAAAAAALGLGLTLEEVAGRLADAPQVPGRMERLATRPCVVLRDYAHTPDALERALRTLRPLTPGRLIVLFGAGGDRDRGKRPLMGAVAAARADVVIVTSDNPRTEDPERILDDVVAGMGATVPLRIVDRREAIARALGLAAPGDTLILAGKGHETYQVLGTVKHPFDEREVVRALVGDQS